MCPSAFVAVFFLYATFFTMLGVDLAFGFGFGAPPDGAPYLGALMGGNVTTLGMAALNRVSPLCLSRGPNALAPTGTLAGTDPPLLLLHPHPPPV